MVRRTILLAPMYLVLAMVVCPNAQGSTPAAATDTPIRELYIPFEHIAAVLERQPRRVLLSREAYETLQRKAHHESENRAPRSSLLVSADYTITIDGRRAEVLGAITIDVLEDGLYALPIDLGGVGLRAATLDGEGAPIMYTKADGYTVFVEGVGRHELVLTMVTRVETDAATQSLTFVVPSPPATKTHLVVPGDVEIKRGAHVLSRTFDEDARVTRFDLLPISATVEAGEQGTRGVRHQFATQPGKVSLLLSLNNRTKQARRVVVSRSVIVHEITRAYEQVHATFSMTALHHAVDRFRFDLSDGVELTEVKSPTLSHWSIEPGDNGRVLEVRLRTATTIPVLLTLSGVVTGGKTRLHNWTLPRITPLDVARQVAVLGILVEDGLTLSTLESHRLIPIDARVITRAFPPSVLSRESGGPTLRAVAAYYAPVGLDNTTVRARFDQPRAALSVVTRSSLTLSESHLELSGSFTLHPEVESALSFDFTAPGSWHVQRVSDAQGTALPFEVHRSGPTGNSRINVRLPSGVAPGNETQVTFLATHVPPDWLTEWNTTTVDYPVFAVSGATHEVGALVVQTDDDLTVYPEAVEGLLAIDKSESAAYAFTGETAAYRSTVYRFDAVPYRGVFRIERVEPRLTAQTYSFFHVDPDVLSAHYEIAFDIEDARVRRLAILLPATTPPDISIRALDGIEIKEYAGTLVDGMRRWMVLLGERTRDRVRLSVSFKAAVRNAEETVWPLPVVIADGVAYQSGFVSVEGSAGIDLSVTNHPREVDIGELAGASYRPDRTILGPPRGGGVFAFVGDNPKVSVSISRPPEHALPSTIVQRAELVTLVSDEGLSQTTARFLLHTKAAFLQVELPVGSDLWAVELDGTPLMPQRQRGNVLVSLPARAGDGVRDLRVTYETPVDRVTFWSELSLSAPKLLLPSAGERTPGVEAPMADVDWRLYVPTGFDIVNHAGSVTGPPLHVPDPAAKTIATFLYRVAGGVDLFYFLPSLSRARELSKRLTATGRIRGIATSSRVYHEDSVSVTGARVGQKKRKAPRRAMKNAHQELAAMDSGSDALDEKSARVSGATSGDAGESDAWALAGVRSLKIDLAGSGIAATFRSLGHSPRLTVTLANDNRVQSLAWGLALAIGAFGLVLARRGARTKAWYVMTFFGTATLLPFVIGGPVLTVIANPTVYVVGVLGAIYLLLAMVRAYRATITAWRNRSASAAGTTVTALALLLSLSHTAQAHPPAADGGADNPVHVRVVEKARPITVPDDAIIIPFDPSTELNLDRNAGLGIPEADQVLVPYDTYIELLDHIPPETGATTDHALPGFALAGAAYRTTLGDGDFLEVTGYLELDVLTDRDCAVPLQLGGGVLVRAVLDGEPAQLGVTDVVSNPARSTHEGDDQQWRAASLTLPVRGKGRHRLDLTMRLKVARKGGLSRVKGSLPAAPAAAMTVRVPLSETEIRLGGMFNRRDYETTSPDESIETALGDDGSFTVAWRPKVHEGRIDPSLTVTSEALFDVREDRPRLIWRLDADFGRTETEAFSVQVPDDYLVQTVDGPNVRGWSMTETRSEQGETSERELRVMLLKPARQSGSVTFVLSRTAQTPAATASIRVPSVRVRGALLHTGVLTIRRSERLQILTERATGMTRTDTSEDAIRLAQFAGTSQQSPLGVTPYQSYTFAAVPFDVVLTVAPVRPTSTVELQTVLRIGERRRDLETRIVVRTHTYPVYSVMVALPGDLDITHVSAPTKFDWSVTNEPDGRILHVFLANGLHDQFSIVLRGTLGQPIAIDGLDLPRLEVLGVGHQAHDIVVQVDPAFNIHASDLQKCREVPIERTRYWLTSAQRPLARLALRCQSADCAARFELSPREPLVTCTTITNVRVTESAVEETVLLDYDIDRAGIRSVSFLLPSWMKDAHITTPMLRQKTIEPIADSKDNQHAQVRVRLELQDEVMGRLRILIENDRLLTGQTQHAPIPEVETGRVERSFVTLENAGRDEIVIDRVEGLEVLFRQQRQWQTLTELLGRSPNEAYVVNGADPALSFKTTERSGVATVGARIGLAETVYVVDEHGTYRVSQSYRMDNRSEQFLEIELPEDAQLWSAIVDHEPVKPVRLSGVGAARRVRIPLVRTADGDLDFVVLLKYGGHMPAPNMLQSTSFPLVRSVNVPVELSQVQLFLPETYRWLNFGGTMGQVANNGSLAAEYVRYQTSVAERLTRTMRDGSPFAQVRAANNLERLKLEMVEHRRRKLPRVYNSDWSQSLASSDAVVRAAETQSQEIMQRPEKNAAVEDNRARLNRLYDTQTVSRARNRVQDLPGNFAAAAPTVRLKQEGRFSRDWLAANQLSHAQSPDSFAGEHYIADDVSQSTRPRYETDRSASMPSKPNVLPNDKDHPAQSGVRQTQRPNRRNQSRRRVGTKETLAQYQRQLQQQAVPEPKTLAHRVAGALMPADARTEAMSSGIAGLASLAVDFPTRGIAFRFTTPRGKVAITARAVPLAYIKTAYRTAGALAVVVLFIGLAAGVKRLRRRMGDSAAWSTLAIIFGAGGFVVGVLPVLGLAMLVVGVFAKIDRRRRKRTLVTT